MGAWFGADNTGAASQGRKKDGTHALTVQHDATRQSYVKSKRALVAMGNSRGGLRLTVFEACAANAAACAQQTQA